MTSATLSASAIVDDQRGAVEQIAWDQAVLATSGQLLQSWRWGAFKARHGWRTERIRVERNGERGLAQLLFNHRGPVSVGYIARGPLLSHSDSDLADQLMTTIDQVCRRHRALYLILEPEAPLPFARPEAAGFVLSQEHIQPARTVKIPLMDDKALLNQMHQKTRYNVRLAQRRGVTVERATPDGAAVATFYELLEDTARRNEFGVHTATYYQDFLQIFGDDALLLFAVIDQRPVAGLIAARFGPEAVYMYGASSTAHRENAAGFYLQFEAMRWAREQGCLRYDLWGIPATDPPPVASDESDRIPGTRGTDWRGLYQFKVRFGGDIVSYPPTLERRYHRLLSALARRVYRSGG